jgi:hypothetical protein
VSPAAAVFIAASAGNDWGMDAPEEERLDQPDEPDEPDEPEREPDEPGPGPWAKTSSGDTEV